MRRKLLFILFLISVMCCLFAITAFAQSQTYYLVQSADSEATSALLAEGKTNIVTIAELTSSNSSTPGTFFQGIQDNSSVEFILAENIVTSGGENEGILINKPITVTIVYNGFIHAVTNGNRFNGIALRHGEARVRLIGSQGVGENGEISTEFVAPTYQNGAITSRGNLDAYHSGKVYVWVFDGYVYAENMRTVTGEEFVYSESNSNKEYEFISCACNTDNYAIGLQGSNGKIVKLENGYYSGLQAYSVLTGSYAKNITVEGKGLHLDSWLVPGNIWELTGCTINKISTSTGRTHLKLIDCTVDPANLSLNGDGGGDQFVRIYKSATCTEPGSLEIYRSTGRGSDNPYAEELANFSAPALGHSYSWAHIYAGDKFVSALTVENACTNCGDVTEAIIIDAMFNTLGFSVPEFGGGLAIVVGYKINNDAIAQYEALTGFTINFGCVVALKDKLGEFNAPLDENGDAVVLQSGRVIKTDVTSNKLAYMDLKVSLTGEHVDLSLLMSAFITETTNEGVWVSYLQSENQLVKDNQFTYVSFNNH